MMKFLAQVIVVALSLGQLSQALPQGGMAIPNHAMICDDARSRGRQAYRNIKETTYDGPVELATGQSCRSSAGDGCSITKAYTWSKGTTTSVGFFAGGGANVNQIWNLQASVSFSYSWTTTKGESTSTSITCPKSEGGLVCGMAVLPRMVNITGETRREYRDMEDCDDGEWAEFPPITSPRIKKTRGAVSNTGVGDEDGADVTFFACIVDCEDVQACIAAVKDGLDSCPLTDPPKAVVDYVAAHLFEDVPPEIQKLARRRKL